MDAKRLTRRNFLKSVSQGSAALVLPTLLQKYKVSKKRNPNIIIIMADDLGYGDLSCYGNTEFQTANIDKLASTGMRFTDFHSNGAVCTPTRAALLTGRYQQRCGLEAVLTVKPENQTKGMDTSEVTFARVFKEAGYKVAAFGKWHLGYLKKYNPLHFGFDEFKGYLSGNVDYHSHYDSSGKYDWWFNLEQKIEEGYTTDLITDHTIDYIKKNKNKPFCVYVAHEAPHYPFQGRNDKADRSPNTKFPNHGTREDKKNAYREMIIALDESVGKIVDNLNSLDLKNDTFVFFCSDNGGLKNIASNGSLKGNKGTLWEGGHRVPAVAFWPGKINPGIVSEDLIMSMDLFPTIISIAGIELSNTPKFDGVDFSKVIFENKKLGERSVFWRFRKFKAARKGKWKLVIHDSAEFLFDLSTDLEEKNNLIDEEIEIAALLKNELADWENDVGSQNQMKTN